MSQLTQYLQTLASRPFKRPDCDCCFSVVDWVLIKTGVDPAPDLRGTYVNATGALRLVRAWGGFENMWRHHMLTAGFQLTDSPEDGDVGVVRDQAGQVVSAIRFRGRWVAKTTSGVVVEDFETLCAWSLSHG